MLLAWGCSERTDEPVVATGDAVPIGFTASLSVATSWLNSDPLSAGNATTRADDDIDLANLKLAGKGFGVFASYTGLHKYSESDVTSDFMYNDRIWWNAGRWVYEPLRYWPDGQTTGTGDTSGLPHFVSFFAYGPYSYSDTDDADPENRPADYCIQSFHYPSEHTNPWLVYRLHPDVTKQVDLLYAQMLDQTKPLGSENTPVLFSFKHALACVGDQLTFVPTGAVQGAVDARGDGTTLRLTHVSLTYHLTEKARLSLWSPTEGEANWQPILSENFLTEREVELLDEEPEDGTVIYTANGSVTNNVMSGEGVYYIPLEVGDKRQSATVHVTYVVMKNGNVLQTIEGDDEIYLSDYHDAYQSDKRLNIKVTLDNFR